MILNLTKLNKNRTKKLNVVCIVMDSGKAYTLTTNIDDLFEELAKAKQSGALIKFVCLKEKEKDVKLWIDVDKISSIEVI